MCFTLFMAASKPAPLIEWNQHDRHFNVGQLDELDQTLRDIFSLPHMAYLGSSKRCGCGFRNATLQDGTWPEAEYFEYIGNGNAEEQQNHDEIEAYLRSHFSIEPFVELYGVWESDSIRPPVGRSTILLDDLASRNFVFSGAHVIHSGMCLSNKKAFRQLAVE